MNRLLHITQRMLVIALCLCAAGQVNAITIKVQKGGTAPYLYAYLGSGDGATKLTGDWPGTQFTEKDDNGYWTMDIPNQSTINLILNMGNGQPQTADYLNISGVDGVASFIYDGNTTMYGTIPSTTFSSSKIYFIKPPTWGTVTAKPMPNGGDYDHQVMTYVGVDGAGLEIYSADFSHWTSRPSTVQFYDNQGNYTANEGMAYADGAYYSTSNAVTYFSNIANDNAFTDVNFKAAVQEAMGTGAVSYNSVTVLDVSNHNITSLAGIEKFPNLIELNASHNSISANPSQSFASNSNLEVLDLSYNATIQGLTSNGAAHCIDLCSNSNLQELYIANCDVYYMGPISHNTNLRVLDMANNSRFDYILKSSREPLTKLEYLDMSGNNLNDNMGFGQFTALKYLNVSNNTAHAKTFIFKDNNNLEKLIARSCNLKQNNFNSSNFNGASNLRYLDISGSTVPNELYLTNKTKLDTLILDGCTGLATTTPITTVSACSQLKYLSFNNVNLYINSLISSLANAKSSLEYLSVDNAQLLNPSPIVGFTALKTVNAKNNPSLSTLTFSNCPAIQTIDVSGNTNMAELGLLNQGYNNSNFTLPSITATGCEAFKILNMSDNSFTSVPELPNLPGSIQSLKLNNNALTSLTMPSGSPIQFLYAENNSGFNGGDYELTAEAAGSLKGLDLGNNGFTSFKAVGTALSALMIGNNTGLTTLELHGNNNLTCTTAGTTMSEGSGLYLLGNTNLESINIENSKFNNIGANNSLLGLSKVKTLRASHNEFKTFTNSNYTNEDSRDHTLSNIAGKPSLEDLTGLEYLDLSYNLLKDSVHLYRNTQLKRLDVSHNQILGPLPTTPDERTAMIDKKLKAALKYGKTYNGGAVGKSVELTEAIRTALTKEDHYRNETRYADFRPCDLRDTTGIFHLDLTYNPKLEYIDISYTNIHNTAAGREYMNPGWESNEGEDSWYSWVDTPAPNQNYGTVKHHFIWMQPAGANLRVFKCDHNNMQSLGTVYYANLDTLSASHMYGDCLFMAGHAGDHIGWGSKEFNNGNCQNARYIDFSYGNYYSFTPTNLTNVEKLILTGNPLGGGHYPDYVLDVTHNSKLQQLQADQCTDLQTIEAHSLNDLAILDVTGNTALKTLRAYDDPVLYNAQTDFITGLSGCSNLEELWVSNDNLPVLDVAYNTKLKTLKCYDNARLPELNLDKNTALSYLDFHNCKLNNIDLRQNKALTYLDCSSEAVATNIHEDGKNKLSDLDIYSDIQTVIANCNNLYRMTGLNKQSLTRLEFEHNHINGIDLSNTGLTQNTLKDEDNGRTIAADYTIVTVKDADNNTTHYDLYYFQLDSLKTSQNEVFLGGKHSVDTLKQNVPDYQGYRDNLNYEGLVSTKITEWTAHATGPIVGRRPNTYANAYIDPSNVNSLIDPDKISGTIVVLDEHNKRAEYTYDTGVSGHTSTYYLDWTAPATPTAVTDIETDAKPTVTGGNGIISVTAPDGTAVMVYDMAGRLVQQATATGGEVVIDGMSPGVYIVNGEKVIVK